MSQMKIDEAEIEKNKAIRENDEMFYNKGFVEGIACAYHTVSKHGDGKMVGEFRKRWHKFLEQAGYDIEEEKLMTEGEAILKARDICNKETETVCYCGKLNTVFHADTCIKFQGKVLFYAQEILLYDDYLKDFVNGRRKNDTTN